MVQVETKCASTLKVGCCVLLDWFNFTQSKKSLTFIFLFIQVLRLDQMGGPHVIFQHLSYYVFLLNTRLVIILSVVDVCFMCVCGRHFVVDLKQML